MQPSGFPDAPDLRSQLEGPDRPLRMAEMAGAIGRLRGTERALFGWLGRSAVVCELAPVATWASGASLRAAWRSSQLEALMPVSAGVPAAGARTGGLAALDELPAAVDTSLLEVAVRWYGLLGHAYRFRLGRLTRAADGHVERVLRRVVVDLEDETASARAALITAGRTA